MGVGPTHVRGSQKTLVHDSVIVRQNEYLIGNKFVELINDWLDFGAVAETNRQAVCHWFENEFGSSKRLYRQKVARMNLTKLLKEQMRSARLKRFQALLAPTG